MPLTPDMVAANLTDESWLSRLVHETLSACLRPLRRRVSFESDDGRPDSSWWERDEFPMSGVSLAVFDFSEKVSEPGPSGCGPTIDWHEYKWRELVLLASGRFAVVSH